MKISSLLYLGLLGILFTTSACDDDDGDPMLDVPTTYTSDNFEANVTAERAVITELSAMTTAANLAETNAQSGTTIPAIPYPSTLRSVTEGEYADLVEDWLVELVAAANSPDGFQTPDASGPVPGQEGGKLGSRLLDENGLELEQMVQKGSFGAALYNHAVDVIENGDLTDPGTIDKLVEIHGTEVDFAVDETTAAATYSRRRSDLTAQTGFFFDIRDALLTARAAIEGGREFDEERDQALNDYLEAWEKSNYATVIFYANRTIDLIQEANNQMGEERENTLGDAMHAYAEGVGFTHGFRRIDRKIMTDAQIDTVLGLLQAPAGQTPESYRFLIDPDLLTDLQTIVTTIQGVYGFTEAEVQGFYVNNNP
ncbi:MAG: hypothetical protein AAF741_15210 [Bacteroidota bacterium]